MCGIAGIFDLKGEREIDRVALARMSEALIHRGPDGAGEFIAPGVGLAHRRLAIIDIDGGAQPFLTKECALSYNGEIYNFKLLSDDLRQRGVAIKTRSDTEVLAEGLAREGDAYIEKLRGMYAFAFWDKKRRSLLLARDRMGEKPLFYALTQDGFLLFASEIGALLSSRLLSPSLNAEAVADYFFYGYIPDPKTIYEGVKKLPPGHHLYLTANGNVTPTRYWRPSFAPSPSLKFHDAADLLREKIDGAVRAQMISDVPLGAFLSGGVDSSGIVAAMAATGAAPVACTIGFDEASHDERGGALEIAQKFGAVHHEHVASFDADNLIEKVAGVYGEPFADSSAIPSYLVAQMARRHVKVALSGDGGDEVFAGYRRYPFFLAEERVRALAPHALRKSILGPLGAFYPKLDWAPRPLRAKTTLQSLSVSRGEAYANAVAINLPSRASAMLSTDLQAKLAGYRPQLLIQEAMKDADTDDPLAAAQYADYMTWLPGRMLTKIDRASMAHSLEVRPPLLDYRLVEWAGRLPSEFKVTNGDRKRILKTALTPRLGEEFVNRPKRGFDMPVSDWLRLEKSSLAARITSSNLWRESGLLNVAKVEAMLRSHRSGKSDCGQELWSVIMFDAFLRCASN